MRLGRWYGVLHCPTGDGLLYSMPLGVCQRERGAACVDAVGLGTLYRQYGAGCGMFVDSVGEMGRWDRNGDACGSGRDGEHPPSVRWESGHRGRGLRSRTEEVSSTLANENGFRFTQSDRGTVGGGICPPRIGMAGPTPPPAARLLFRMLPYTTLGSFCGQSGNGWPAGLRCVCC